MTGVLAFLGRNTLDFLRYVSGLYDLSTKAAYWSFVAPFKGRHVKWGNAVIKWWWRGSTPSPLLR